MLWQPSVVGGHQCTGRVFRVLNQGGDVATVGFVDQPEQLVGNARRQPSHEIAAVVVRHLFDELGHAIAADAIHHRHLPIDGEILKNGRLRFDVGVTQKLPNFFDVEFASKGFGHGHWVKGFAKRLHAVVVMLLEHQSGFGTK